MKEMQREILEILQEIIEVSQEAAVITEVPGTDMESLHAEFSINDRKMMVSVIFMPASEPNADTSLAYKVVVDIVDDIPEEKIAVLKSGLPYINYGTYKGSFLTTPDCKSLLYQNSGRFHEDDEAKDVVMMMLYYMEYAIFNVKNWADLLIDVAEGRKNMEEYIQAIAKIRE